VRRTDNFAAWLEILAVSNFWGTQSLFRPAQKWLYISTPHNTV